MNCTQIVTISSHHHIVSAGFSLNSFSFIFPALFCFEAIFFFFFFAMEQNVERCEVRRRLRSWKSSEFVSCLRQLHQCPPSDLFLFARWDLEVPWNPTSISRTARKNKRVGGTDGNSAPAGHIHCSAPNYKGSFHCSWKRTQLRSDASVVLVKAERWGWECVAYFSGVLGGGVF